MEFNADKPIYRQIIDYAFGCILNGAWEPGKKVPSVRELAVAMAVNSHTVLKAYEQLENDGIIAPRRGMGFFLTDEAPALVAAQQRREFFTNVLDSAFARMELLGITIDDVVAHYNELKSK